MQFTDYFKPMPGDTKAQILKRFEALFDQLHEMAKKGYEHDGNKCKEATVINGEKQGGWVDPKTGTCSACGFYVGRIATHVSALRQLEAQFSELPDDYVYMGGTDGGPEQDGDGGHGEGGGSPVPV